MASFLFITTVITKLIIIGPNKAGFYGFDPYRYTLQGYKDYQSGLDVLISAAGNFPAFHSLTEMIVVATGLDVLVVGKYLPLISAAVPLFLFVGLVNMIDKKEALIIAVVISSAKTFIMFESKFIEETLAITLFFFIASLLLVADRGYRRDLLIFISIIVLSLTHHYSAIITLLVFVIWTYSPMLSKLNITNRFDTYSSETGVNQVHLLIVITIIGVTFAIIYSEFTAWTTASFFTHIEQGLLKPPSGVVGVKDSGNVGFFEFNKLNLNEMISRMGLFLYPMMSVIIAMGFLSNRKIYDWQQSWSVVAGLLSAGFAGTMILGRFLPLSAGRFVPFMFPFLVICSFTAVFMKQNKIFDRFSETWIVLFAFLIIGTQLAGIHPHLLVADDRKMVYEEGHYTPSEFAAAEWTISYGEKRIIAEKSIFWDANGYTNVELRNKVKECTGYGVERKRFVGIEQWNRPDSQNVIYTAGGISIGSCPVVFK